MCKHHLVVALDYETSFGEYSHGDMKTRSEHLKPLTQILVQKRFEGLLKQTNPGIGQVRVGTMVLAVSPWLAKGPACRSHVQSNRSLKPQPLK